MRFPVFAWVYQALTSQGFLQRYQVRNGQLLVGLDGTASYASNELHCQQCSHRTHKTGQVSAPHRAILPLIVAPGQEHGLFGADGLTLIGDDLYRRQPMGQLCIEHQVNFIVVCLPTSHLA